MSRELGQQLPDELVEQLAGGMAAIVTWMSNAGPECRVAHGLAAGPDWVELVVVDQLPASERVSVHTLGPSVCAILGTVVERTPSTVGTRIRVEAEHVKDDRPPGLDVEPFRLHLDDRQSSG